MSEREYKHENKERLCYCCDELQESEKDIIRLNLSGRGYGSLFDGMNTYIQLCKKCYKPEYEEWFNETPEYEDYCEQYKHEEDIINLINTFSIENQEYFWNSNATGWNIDEMDRQDWIDMKNGTLSEEKYKKYNMYAPSEIKAYKERFATCEYPVNVIYSDGSKYCLCPFGAYGEYNQNINDSICDECCYCKYYKKRETPIKEISEKDFDDYELYIKSRLKEKELKEKFE